MAPMSAQCVTQAASLFQPPTSLSTRSRTCNLRPVQLKAAAAQRPRAVRQAAIRCIASFESETEQLEAAAPPSADYGAGNFSSEAPRGGRGGGRFDGGRGGGGRGRGPAKDITVKLEDLQPGDQLQGVVRACVPYGAFVDIGARCDGLVHISQLSDDYTHSVYDVVQPGDEVVARVLSVDLERGRLALSMREPQAQEGGDNFY